MTLKVIVFGAAGNVGTVAVESALQAGHQVTAFIHQTPLPDHLADKVHYRFTVPVVDASLSASQFFTATFLE